MKPEHLDELIEKLKFVTKLDGIVSEDERNLMNTVELHVDKFKVAYQEAWDDGIISPEEKEILRKLWKNIMIESTKTAIKDNVYSKDELSIIFRLFTTLIRNLD